MNYYNKLMLEIENLTSREQVKKLQKIINKVSGSKLVIDGIIGRKTLSAIISYEERIYIMLIGKSSIKKNNTFNIDNDKDYLMNYLAEAEGLTLHWNKRETGYTTPYGIYQVSNRGSNIIKYVDSVLKNKKLDPSRPSHRRRFNQLMKSSPRIRNRIKDLAWELIKERFIDKETHKLLKIKTRLSYFSIGINGGRSRAGKSLQRVLGVTDDGRVGNQTRTKLKQCKLDDNELNQGILNEMFKFYNYLINKDSVRYGLNERGWNNRLYRLGYKKRSI